MQLRAHIDIIFQQINPRQQTSDTEFQVLPESIIALFKNGLILVAMKSYLWESEHEVPSLRSIYSDNVEIQTQTKIYRTRENYLF